MSRTALLAAVGHTRQVAHACVLAAAALALAACAPLATTAPATVDFTGEWLLDPTLSGAPPNLEKIRRREERAIVRGRQRNARASAAFAVQDFPVLSAETLRIEQNAGSMGVQYGGGLYRDVSWGKRERDFWTIQAGWQEGALVIRSERGAVKGRETLTLERGGTLLRVAVQVETGGESIETVRVFRRR